MLLDFNTLTFIQCGKVKVSSTGAHLASYPMGIQSSFPGGKAAGT